MKGNRTTCTAKFYERVRKQRPDLHLPEWVDLICIDRRRARRMTPDELIARRTAKLLGRPPGTIDNTRQKPNSGRGPRRAENAL